MLLGVIKNYDIFIALGEDNVVFLTKCKKYRFFMMFNFKIGTKYLIFTKKFKSGPDERKVRSTMGKELAYLMKNKTR